jgi:cytochrome c553
MHCRRGALPISPGLHDGKPMSDRQGRADGAARARDRSRRRAGAWGAGGLLFLAVLPPATGRAGDPAAGRLKAGACTVCHGELGLSQAPDVPHLAGQPEVYLVEQLKAYRSGKRVHEVMTVAAKGLSDADIENLAAWYSSLAVRVETPKK